MNPPMRFRGALLASTATVFAAALLTASGTPAQAEQPTACKTDPGGITLSPGFCATVFADHLGHARHLAVASNGVVYVNTWSGRYYHDDTPPPGGMLIALQDTTHSGKADKVVRFGPSFAEGDHGGTGIALYKGYLYAETNDRIVRYALPPNGIVPTGAPETVVSGLPSDRRPPDAPVRDRRAGQPLHGRGFGDELLPEPESHAERPRHATLHRAGNPGRHLALRCQQAGSAFLAGRTLRHRSAQRRGHLVRFRRPDLRRPSTAATSSIRIGPACTTPLEGQNEPAEELVQEHRGADFGWPECYYDYDQKKLVLAPEYGGDGGKTVGVCAQKQEPVAAFPAHWAPNDMLIYEGSQFPTAYKDGAFIAFHGSWNRAPGPQGGYNVVFQPLADGKASGPFVVFADGFAGADKEPGRATHRPTGLAVGPDGAFVHR